MTGATDLWIACQKWHVFLSLNLCSKKIILNKIKIIDILKFEENTNYISYISLINKTIQQ